jgi:hypothetical protein
MAVKATAMLFSCKKVGDKHLLFFEMDIDCSSESHRIWQYLFGLPVLILSIFILPGLLFRSIYKHRHHFQTNCTSEEDGAMHLEPISGDKEEAVRRFGFIVNNYRDECYYWNFVIMWRKIFVAMVVVLTQQYGIVLQAMLVMLGFVFAIMYHIHSKPFKTHSMDYLQFANAAEMVSSITVLLTVWLGVLMSESGISHVAKEICTFAIVGINILAIVCFLVMLTQVIPYMQIPRISDLMASSQPRSERGNSLPLPPPVDAYDPPTLVPSQKRATYSTVTVHL